MTNLILPLEEGLISGTNKKFILISYPSFNLS